MPSNRAKQTWPQARDFVQHDCNPCLKRVTLAGAATHDKPTPTISQSSRGFSMRNALSCLALTILAIAGFWTWLGRPVPMPVPEAARGAKLYCVSYTPFRGAQTPLDPSTMIPASQIEDDLTALAKITDCVRTYS